MFCGEEREKGGKKAREVCGRLKGGEGQSGRETRGLRPLGKLDRQLCQVGTPDPLTGQACLGLSSFSHQSQKCIRITWGDFSKNAGSGASLVAQWLRVCLPMQGTRVRALVWEDPTCRGATKPVSHNY